MAANRIILLLCLASAATGVAQSSKPTVRHHRVEDTAGAALARAEAAMDAKDYARAEAALEQAVKADPDNYRAWYDFGVIYSATGRSNDAISAYRKSIAAYPKLFESNFNLGMLLGHAGDPEAVTYLRAATQLTPTGNREQGLAKAWTSLAWLLHGQDRLDAFRHASELQPNDSGLHVLAGDAAEAVHDMVTAEQEYKTAVALAPKSSDAIAGLANLYLESKRLPQAEETLRKYVAVTPGDGKAHLLLGRVLAAEGKTEEAEPEFETALRLSPGDGADSELAMLYVSNKEFAKAEPLFRAALQKDPKNAELHHRLGTALLEQEKFADAQQELLMAVNLKPDYGIAYGDLAFAASENKEYPLTIKALDARARYLPEIPATLFLRATAYDHLHAYKLAAAAYRQFLAASDGKFPDQEWQARHRLIAIEPKK